jgi:hypothetical protein
MYFGPARRHHVAVMLAVLGSPAFGRANDPPFERPSGAPVTLDNLVVRLGPGGALRVDGVRVRQEGVRAHVTRYLWETGGKGTVIVECGRGVAYKDVMRLLEELRDMGAPPRTRLRPVRE